MSRRGTNIRKRTDGRWEGRYYIVDTAGSKKCKSVYGHSYKEVTERLLTAKAASLNQTVAPKQPAITVKAVAEKWLESIATSRKCSTIQKYSTIYNKYIKPNWGESVIDQLKKYSRSCLRQPVRALQKAYFVYSTQSLHMELPHMAP